MNPATAVRVTVASEIFATRLRPDLAPQSCQRFLDMLPYRGLLIHARWSGESCWSPLADHWPAGQQLPPESATSNPPPGQVLLFANEHSEPELLFPYGPTRFCGRAGPLAGNPVLTIDSPLSRLAVLGQRIWLSGVLDLRIELHSTGVTHHDH